MAFLVRVFFCVVFFPIACFAIEVDIFSTGQGNTVLLRHDNQAIMIDAGSSESKFRALYHSRSEKNIASFELESTHLTKDNSINITSSRKRKGSFPDDSSQSGASTEHDPESGNKKTQQTKLTQQYIDDVIEDIRSKLPQNAGKYVLKTLVITHADKDHYNLIAKIFTDPKKTEIGTLILSGFKDDYTNNFQDWLQKFPTSSHRTSAIKRVIFTGMYNGGENKQMGEGELGYARAYYSGMSDQTEIEKKIEEALNFSSGKSNTEAPQLKVLSMNAGHTTEKSGLIRISNDDKNSNSLVLRLEAEGQSFLFAADATNATWEHIRANFWKKEEELQTDYILLSHHGSADEGATREDMLKLFNPKACFLSVGRHLAYHHPREDVLDILMSLSSILTTKNHVVSYFGRQGDKDNFSYKRRRLTQAIFSTLNHGTLSLILQKREQGEKSIVRTSSYMETVFEGMEHNILQKFSVDYDNVYCVEKGKIMQEALQELTNATFQQNKKRIFWKKGTGRSNKIILYTPENLSNLSESKEELHMLIEEDKGRVYFLERMEEGGNDSKTFPTGKNTSSSSNVKKRPVLG